MLHKLIVASAWLCLVFIIYATLSSIDARPVIAGGFFTVLERFGAYAVFGFVFYFAYPRHLTLACIVVFGSAVTLELLQNFVPDRDPRFVDAMEKLLGGTAGIVLGRIFQSSFWLTLITGNDRSQRD
jgi:VanZ family protein